MSSRIRTRRIRHEVRDFCPSHPLHVTMRVERDMSSLCRSDVYVLVRELMVKVKRRGMRVVAWQVMPDHLHLFVKATSREALEDVMGYFGARLAKGLNRIFGRRGKVFVDRYWSTVCRSVLHAWQTVGYILRNPARARRLVRCGTDFDRFGGVDRDAIDRDRFLRSCLGEDGSMRRSLLRRMVTEVVPFVPFGERIQPDLPGLV